MKFKKVVNEVLADKFKSGKKPLPGDGVNILSTETAPDEEKHAFNIIHNHFHVDNKKDVAGYTKSGKKKKFGDGHYGKKADK